MRGFTCDALYLSLTGYLGMSIKKNPAQAGFHVKLVHQTRFELVSPKRHLSLDPSDEEAKAKMRVCQFHHWCGI